MSKQIEFLHHTFPQQMGTVYCKYGLPHAKLTVQNTEDLATVYGDKFIHDVETLCSFEGDNFGGKLKGMFHKKDKGSDAPLFDEDGHPITEEGTRAGSKDDKSQDSSGGWKEKLKNFGAKAFATYNQVKGSQGQGSQNGNEAPGRSSTQGDTILGMSKPLFYGLCAVALILIVYAVSRSKKSAVV